jgi:hypothetical protein
MELWEEMWLRSARDEPNPLFGFVKGIAPAWAAATGQTMPPGDVDRRLTQNIEVSREMLDLRCRANQLVKHKPNGICSNDKYIYGGLLIEFAFQ